MGNACNGCGQGRADGHERLHPSAKHNKAQSTTEQPSAEQAEHTRTDAHRTSVEHASADYTSADYTTQAQSTHMLNTPAKNRKDARTNRRTLQVLVQARVIEAQVQAQTREMRDRVNSGERGKGDVQAGRIGKWAAGGPAGSQPAAPVVEPDLGHACDM